jgi:hypothetical protein
MAETTSRVARWRQRLREEGKTALTIWLTTDEKLRLEDMGRTWHTSPSALVQQALAQFQPTRPPASSKDTDTTQLRLLIQEVLHEELPGMVRDLMRVTEMNTETVAATPSTDTVTDAVAETVTATLARDLPALVRQMVEEMALEALGLPVAATDSDVAVTEPSGEMPAAEAPAEDLAGSPVGQNKAHTGHMLIGQYKLTPRQVRSLRAKRQRGATIQSLMEEYGISRATLFRYLQ